MTSPLRAGPRPDVREAYANTREMCLEANHLCLDLPREGGSPTAYLGDTHMPAVLIPGHRLEAKAVSLQGAVSVRIAAQQPLPIARVL